MLKNISFHNVQRGVSALLIALFLIGVVFYQAPTQVAAQDGQNLPFDSLQLGVVTGPQGVVFNFLGNAGDAIEIQTAGLNNFAPVIILQGPDRAVLAQEINAGSTDDATLSATLPSTGIYFIVVTGVNNTVGQFTILLTRGLPPGFPLTPNGITEGIAAPTIPQIYYDLPLDQINNTRVEVRSQTLGYSPQITVFGSDGTVIALIGGNRALSGALEFGPGTEILKVLVAIGEFQNQANFQVLWTLVNPNEGSPIITPEPGQPTGSTTTGGCQITPNSSNPVNVRAGGSTDHPQVGVLQANQSAAATGISALNGGWFEIQLSNGVVGWVASFVVTTSGNCSGLPTKSFPPAPTGGTGPTGPTNTPGGPTSTPTVTPTQGIGPTSTATATLGQGQPTLAPTATATATTAVQIAPPDQQQIFFELDISGSPSQRSVTVSDVISYPNGDTADRVRYEVTGFSSVVFSARVLVTVTCSGPGAENARIASNFGRTPNQPCVGYSRTFTHTNDSDFQNHEIWLESGNNAFVTWTLTATLLD